MNSNVGSLQGADDLPSKKAGGSEAIAATADSCSLKCRIWPIAVKRELVCRHFGAFIGCAVSARSSTADLQTVDRSSADGNRLKNKHTVKYLFPTVCVVYALKYRPHTCRMYSHTHSQHTKVREILEDPRRPFQPRFLPVSRERVKRSKTETSVQSRLDSAQIMTSSPVLTDMVCIQQILSRRQPW